MFVPSKPDPREGYLVLDRSDGALLSPVDRFWQTDVFRRNEGRGLQMLRGLRVPPQVRLVTRHRPGPNVIKLFTSVIYKYS
jgi:hypothetical protein